MASFNQLLKKYPVGKMYEYKRPHANLGFPSFMLVSIEKKQTIRNHLYVITQLFGDMKITTDVLERTKKEALQRLEEELSDFRQL